MIRSHSLLFFLLLIFCSEKMQSQYFPFYENKNSESGLTMMLLKGKVKSVKQTVYTARDSSGTIIKEKKGERDCCTVNSDFLITFDEKGRTINETYYNAPEKDIIMTHKYNDTKNVEVADQYESQKKPLLEYVYRYNSKGEMVELNQTQFFQDELGYTTKSILKYDDKTNMIECDNDSPTGTSDADGGKTICKYDSNGNKTEQICYNRKNIAWFKDTYINDEEGNLFEHDFYKPDCKTVDHKLIFKYDSNKNITQKNYTNLTYPKESKIWTYKYEYDKNNNWIKRTDFENGKETLILERQFEYY